MSGPQLARSVLGYSAAPHPGDSLNDASSIPYKLYFFATMIRCLFDGFESNAPSNELLRVVLTPSASLANHGILPRSGRNISLDEFIVGLKSEYLPLLRLSTQWICADNVTQLD